MMQDRQRRVQAQAGHNEHGPGAAEPQALADLLSQTLVNGAGAQAQQASAPHMHTLSGEKDNDVITIDIMEMFYRVLANLHFVILCAILFAVGAGIWAAYFVTPMYSATAKLYIGGPNDSIINLADLQIGSLLTKDYQEVFRTWEVHEMVRKELGLNYRYGTLQSMVRVTNPENTRVLYITVRNPNRDEATAIANAYANAAQKFILETMESKKPKAFSTALVPGDAEGASVTSYSLRGFLVGTILALASIVLRVILDDRPRTPEDISRYGGITTLAVLPAESKRRKSQAGRQTQQGRMVGIE